MQEHIDRINKELLTPDMPVIKHGFLYLDGEGTATAPIAKRAAELFNEGAYDSVIMAGGKYPWIDKRALLVFPKVIAGRLPLPAPWAREADYLLSVFRKFADPDKFLKYKKEGKIHVVPQGGNAGAKVIACKKHFEEAGFGQLVTLAPVVPRLVGTIAKECPDVVVTGDRVYPFGMTKEGWHEWPTSRKFVLQEAEKTGPRMDGGKPTFEDRFFTRVDLTEMGKRAQQLALQRG